MRLFDEQIISIRPGPLPLKGLKSPKGSPTSFVSALKGMKKLLMFEFFEYFPLILPFLAVLLKNDTHENLKKGVKFEV